MKSIAALVVVPLLAVASPLFNIGSVHHEAAPVLSSIHAKEIPDSYIVVFKDHVSHAGASIHRSWVQDVHTAAENDKNELRKRSQLPFVSTTFNGLRHTYNIAGSFLGYSGHFDGDVIERIRRHPDVAYVEKDSEVHTMSAGTVEKNAPWGLARISHRDGLSFSTYNKYLYAEDGGEGVDIYIIDTGTNIEHVDFGGRAAWGATIPTGDEDVDGNGHGTHCSGTAAGKKYGVAKKANIKAVKVLRSNGSGSMSDVVSGVDWAVEAHLKEVDKAKSGKRKGFKGSTANMSLGGGKSPTLDRAVNIAVDNGIHFAVAAGNDNADSCKYSPASAEKAVTVGASNFRDERAYFSNYGKCNDIFAPGLDIQSTWIGSKYAVNTISGTSMASPHIAGLLAYFLSMQPAKDSAYAVADISPKKLKASLIAVGTKDALANVPSDTSNVLAWNGGGATNFSEIIVGGSYTVGKGSVPVETILDEVRLGAESVKDGLLDGSAKASQFLKEFAEKIEGVLAQELEEFGSTH